MTLIELEAVVSNLTARMDSLQQILPTLARQADLLATRAALTTTRDELRADLLAMGQDLRKEMRKEMRQAMSDLEERLGSQMLMLHEDAKSDSRLLAEHLARLIERVDGLALLIERRH